MKPLNPTDVIWLAGTPDEIDSFLKPAEIREHAIILGHPDDAKRTLIGTAQPGAVWAMNFKPLLAQEVEIVFLLLQGKVVGLVKEPAREVRD